MNERLLWMKYTPRNPNEHKFKPLMKKLQGFNKRQTNKKKKKQKLSISITTNKMSIIDTYFLVKDSLSYRD